MKLLILYLICTVSAAILGLDYGQQFTKAVLLAPGISFEMVLTDEGKRKDLSGISVRKSGVNDLERVYGSQTGSLCTRFPQSCLLDVKPLLGKTIDHELVSEYLKTHPGIKLVADESRANTIKFDLGFGNESYIFSVEEIVAMNLNEIKNRALANLETNGNALALVEDVAITVPPFISPETRQAYMDALELAGFSNILGLVDEGTAVALNFLSKKKFEKGDYNDVKEYHVVYDMGAGSTVATLFSFVPYSNGSLVLELESIGFDESFGGKKLTNSIYTIITEKFLNHFKLKHSDLTTKIAAKLIETAEKAKIILSANNEFYTMLESIHDEKDFKVKVTRDEFEEFNSDLMAHITQPIYDAIGNRNVKDIKSIVLNGGSTRIPFVKKHLAALVGEDKIAKSVNTDESAALGTTLAGLKLKTQFAKPGDIKLIDKTYHNYEIRVDESDDETLVFAKGSTVVSESKIELGEVSKKLGVGLYEDGRLFKSYAFEDLVKKAEKLSCKSKETKKVFASFSLDHNKAFDVSKVEIECVQTEKPSFFDKFKKEEKVDEVEVEVEGNSTNGTTNSTKPIAKKIVKPISVAVPKPTYPHTKPLLRTTKEKVLNKLTYLKNKDIEKIELEQVKNVLEAQCYDLRGFLEDKEEILLQEISEDDFSGYSSIVSEFIEWLEFESDEASLSDVIAKRDELSEKKQELQRYIQVSQTDLTVEGIQKLHQEASDIASTLQSRILGFGSEVNEIRKKYEKEEFEFDKENSRIKGKLLSKSRNVIAEFDGRFTALKGNLTEVEKILALSPSKFAKLTKSELYDLYDHLSQGIAGLLQDLISIESNHVDRTSQLESKLDKLIARRLQKQIREQLKKEKAAAKKEEQGKQQNEELVDEAAEEAENEAGFFEEDEQEQEVETGKEQEKEQEKNEETKEELEHDEL